MTMALTSTAIARLDGGGCRSPTAWSEFQQMPAPPTREDQPDHERRQRLDASVPVGMFGIGRLDRRDHPDQDHGGRQDVAGELDADRHDRRRSPSSPTMMFRVASPALAPMLARAMRLPVRRSASGVEGICGPISPTILDAARSPRRRRRVLP